MIEVLIYIAIGILVFEYNLDNITAQIAYMPAWRADIHMFALLFCWPAILVGGYRNV